MSQRQPWIGPIVSVAFVGYIFWSYPGRLNAISISSPFISCRRRIYSSMNVTLVLISPNLGHVWDSSRIVNGATLFNHLIVISYIYTTSTYNQVCICWCSLIYYSLTSLVCHRQTFIPSDVVYCRYRKTLLSLFFLLRLTLWWCIFLDAIQRLPPSIQVIIWAGA